MKRTVKKLDSKSKCQCLTKNGTRCTQGAVMIIMDRELSSLASKKVCKLHGFDILMEHCLELQAEIKSMECKSDAQLQREAALSRATGQMQCEELLYPHAPSVIQKLHDKVFKGK